MARIIHSKKNFSETISKNKFLETESALSIFVFMQNMDLKS